MNRHISAELISEYAAALAVRVGLGSIDAMSQLDNSDRREVLALRWKNVDFG